MTPTPTIPTEPSAAAHGWRITWPMILAWLSQVALLVPFAMPYANGEKKLDAAAGLTLFAVLVANLNHSPAPSPGGGLPSAAPLLVVVLGAGLLTGCGATWVDVARGTISAAAVATNDADTRLASGITHDCAAAGVVGAAHSPERHEAITACLHAHRYDDGLAAIAQADHYLRAAQAAVDAGEAAHSAAGWLTALPCLSVSVRGVMAAIQAAGVVLPAEVLASISALQLVPGTCTAGGAS